LHHVRLAGRCDHGLLIGVRVPCSA
jgi:hypothetical protein